MVNFFKKTRMTDEEAYNFICRCSRYEWQIDPVVYRKGIKVALIELGYDEEWVYDDFQLIMERFEYESGFYDGDSYNEAS